jgi:hypothetical protein
MLILSADISIFVLVLDSHLYVGANVFTLLLLGHITNGWVHGFFNCIFQNYMIFFEN